MAGQTTNYQCPACTGPLHFDGATGKLQCDYCGSSYSVEEIEKLYGKKNEKAEENFNAAAKQNKSGEWDASAMEGWGADAAKLNAYNCTSCGAELICDKTTAATECPYCGNPTIIPGQFSGNLKPEFIIPFKLDKQAATDALRRHYSGKKLLPRAFRDENHIQKIQGVYVPFWLYNGSADADVHFVGEQHSIMRTKNEEITTTRIFDLERAGRVTFENIPVDASSKMDDALMDSIEPYDYREMKPFSMSYLPGFLADKYDIPAAECAKRADERAANTAVDVMGAQVVGYDTVREKTRDIQLHRGKVRYGLMPVWMLNTKWGDNNYVFAMNGQTGKLVGNLPEDKSLRWKYHLMYGGIFAAVLLAAQMLLLH